MWCQNAANVVLKLAYKVPYGGQTEHIYQKRQKMPRRLMVIMTLPFPNEDIIYAIDWRTLLNLQKY